MKILRRFINFAIISCMFFLMVGFGGCKGRTAENMQPTGDTVEVVILQDTIVNNNQQIY